MMLETTMIHTSLSFFQTGPHHNANRMVDYSICWIFREDSQLLYLPIDYLGQNYQRIDQRE